MKRSKWLGSGLIAAVAAGLSLVLISTVSAQAPTIMVDSPSINVGEQGTVAVQALDIPAPGLGSWTVDVTYDPAVVSVVPGSCTGMVCNESFAPNMVRVVGFNATGLVGDTTLATISFQCGASAGSSPLSLTVVEFMDATLGDPQPITATAVNGSVTCSVPTSVLMVDSPSINVGEQGTVAVQALDIPAPGLGGWTVDVTYDPVVVSVVPGSCTGMVCNESFAPNMVRVVGFNPTGLVGSTTLATISFQCGASVGTSPLTLTVVEFLDATLGNPQPITATVANGSVTCTTLVKGDCNGDGVATIADALLVAQCAAGLIPCTGAGDVDGDAQETVADALLIAQFVASLIPAL